MTLKRIEPFLHVADMTRSLAFYVGALGFRRAHAWPSDSIVRSMPKPFLGNGLWVVRVTDPDGYKLEFVSPADAPEETVYED